MKVDLGDIDPDALITARGAFYLRLTKFGPRIQAWPRKGARKPSDLDIWYRRQFGRAGYMAANATSLEWQTAEYLARPFTNPPRDLLTAAIYGTLYDVIDPEGNVFPVSEKGPEPLPPPPVPTEDFGMWLWSMADDATSVANDVASQNCKGTMFSLPAPINIKGVAANFTAVATQSYTMSLMEVDVTNNVTAILLQTPQVAYASGRRTLEFPAEFPLLANQRYAIMMNNTGASGATPISMPMSTTARWRMPYLTSDRVRLAATLPLIGSALTNSGTGASPVALLV